ARPRSPLVYQSNRAPTWSFSSAMKPSTDTTLCITTLPITSPWSPGLRGVLNLLVEDRGTGSFSSPPETSVEWAARPASLDRCPSDPAQLGSLGHVHQDEGGPSVD